jgi:hypothetical protein
VGYTTEFKGSFKFNRTPSKEVCNYLNKLHDTAHGEQTEDYGCPSFYCQWALMYEPGQGPSALAWDGEEKFDGYVEWLEIILKEIARLEPGLTLNGDVRWRGEYFYDAGTLSVKDNILTVAEGKW